VVNVMNNDFIHFNLIPAKIVTQNHNFVVSICTFTFRRTEEKYFCNC
jgi:hypothetical protein